MAEKEEKRRRRRTEDERRRRIKGARESGRWRSREQQSGLSRQAGDTSR
jgi:hypothetical protein